MNNTPRFPHPLHHHTGIAIVCLILAVLLVPAVTAANPYAAAGEVSCSDTPVTVTGNQVILSETSGITLDGAAYTHRIGRVSITMIPRVSGLNRTPVSSGNTVINGDSAVLQYAFYRHLIK
ncbi:MAG: hypothetical protein GYA23_00880, partial [Methanomicrobiales archaeon]|nr:hypothetical protein [Methanomicrobiales archaeon]